MVWNTFIYQLVAFVLFGFIKGHFHLEYLKAVFSTKYENLEYYKIYFSGSHYKCPELLIPFL